MPVIGPSERLCAEGVLGDCRPLDGAARKTGAKLLTPFRLDLSFLKQTFDRGAIEQFSMQHDLVNTMKGVHRSGGIRVE